MKKRKYNWHFWVPDWKAQIIIEDSNYQRATNRLKNILSLHLNYWRPNMPKFEFQFGQKI